MATFRHNVQLTCGPLKISTFHFQAHTYFLDIFLLFCERHLTPANMIGFDIWHLTFDTCLTCTANFSLFSFFDLKVFGRNYKKNFLCMALEVSASSMHLIDLSMQYALASKQFPKLKVLEGIVNSKLCAKKVYVHWSAPYFQLITGGTCRDLKTCYPIYVKGLRNVRALV